MKKKQRNKTTLLHKQLYTIIIMCFNNLKITCPVHSSANLFVFLVKNVLKGIGGIKGFFYFFILFNLVLTKLQDVFTDFRNSK